VRAGMSGLRRDPAPAPTQCRLLQLRLPRVVAGMQPGPRARRWAVAPASVAGDYHAAVQPCFVPRQQARNAVPRPHVADDQFPASSDPHCNTCFHHAEATQTAAVQYWCTTKLSLHHPPASLGPSAVGLLSTLAHLLHQGCWFIRALLFASLVIGLLFIGLLNLVIQQTNLRLDPPHCL